MSNSIKRSTRDIAIYTIATTIRQLVGFIMLPIYTRYLTPSDYGVVALLTLSLAVFELVLGARFVQVVPRFYYKADSASAKSKVISSAFIITSAFSLMGVLIIWATQNELADILFGSVNYSFYVAVFGFLLFTIGIENYGLMYLRLMERPIEFFVVSISKLAIQLALNIYLIIFLDFGVMGVVIASVVSSLVFCVYFMYVLLKQYGVYLDINLTRKLIGFTWPLWVAGGAALYIQSSNRYFIRINSSLDEVGLFELASKFSVILAVFVWRPFSLWWQTERFKILKHSEDYGEKFQVVFDLLVSVMSLATMCIILFSGSVIELLSSTDFHEAAVAIPSLTFSIYFFNLSLFFNLSFLAADKTIIIAYLKYLMAIIVTAMYFILIPIYGFFGAGIALLMTNIILFILTYIWSKRCLDLKVNLKLLVLNLITMGAFSLEQIFYPLSTYSLLNQFIIGAILMLAFSLMIFIFIMKSRSTSFLLHDVMKRFSGR